MIKAMDKVGAYIQKFYHWILLVQKHYFVMDNAGGPGSNDTIVSCKKMLEEKYNIDIIFQIPISPYTNVLDFRP